MGYWIHGKKSQDQVVSGFLHTVKLVLGFSLDYLQRGWKTAAKLDIFTQFKFIPLYCSSPLLSSLFPSPPGLFSPQVSLDGTHQDHQPINTQLLPVPCRAKELWAVSTKTRDSSFPWGFPAWFPVLVLLQDCSWYLGGSLISHAHHGF